MTCTTCKQSKDQNRLNAVTSFQQPMPFRASDISVVDTNDEIRKFESDDWNNDRHKLLVIIPESFTPVCETELGAMNKWAAKFDELGCDLIALCTDPAAQLVDWFQQEDSLKERDYLTFSSYLIPAKLTLINNGRAKRASVFVTSDGEVVKQEHFDKVGRSFAELHRQMYAYTTGSYCGEGWNNPEDSINAAT